MQEPLVFRLWASSGLAKLPLDGWVDVPRLGHNTLQVRKKWPIYLVIGHFVLMISIDLMKSSEVRKAGDRSNSICHMSDLCQKSEIS